MDVVRELPDLPLDQDTLDDDDSDLEGENLAWGPEEEGTATPGKGRGGSPNGTNAPTISPARAAALAAENAALDAAADLLANDEELRDDNAADEGGDDADGDEADGDEASGADGGGGGSAADRSEDTGDAAWLRDAADAARGQEPWYACSTRSVLGDALRAEGEMCVAAAEERARFSNNGPARAPGKNRTTKVLRNRAPPST